MERSGILYNKTFDEYMNDENAPKCCSAAVIVLTHEGKYLLVITRNPRYETNKDHKEEYEIPGGKFEPEDKSAFACAEREYREETFDLNTYLCPKRVFCTTSIPPKKDGSLQYFFVMRRDSGSYRNALEANARIKEALRQDETKVAATSMTFIDLEDALNEKCGLPLRKFNLAILKMAREAKII